MKRSWLVVVPFALVVAGCKPTPTDANLNLIDACGYRDVAGVKKALESGADPDAVDLDPNKGYSAIEIVADHPEIVKMLLAAGASATKPGHSGECPITAAAIVANADTLEQLCDAGASVDTKDSNDDTPLALVCGVGGVDSVTVLVTHGADVNSRDKFGLTPLFHIVSGPGKPSDGPAIARFLLSHGADPSAKDTQGRTAADLIDTPAGKSMDPTGEITVALQDAIKAKH